MKYRNVYLIGYRASGKTTLARKLASLLKIRFVDADHELQQQYEMTIDEMVNKHGWPYFREREEKILSEINARQGQVVATGGGVILRSSNRNILTQTQNYCVYLQATISLVLERLNADPISGQRPALSDMSLEQEISTVMSQREQLYLSCADLVMDVSLPVEQIVISIASHLK
ncbi:shikimate kinase AroL [Desulfonatronovibrio magnus]|uniref:shikimate kinase AroL n=1 Tax=Desulfonatronovibrio magnus TaxID=698827 RepID=UPI0005EB220D|nr:shikimate kinase AroL [Desulfonatronovibrio magnus]